MSQSGYPAEIFPNQYKLLKQKEFTFSFSLLVLCYEYIKVQYGSMVKCLCFKINENGYKF